MAINPAGRMQRRALVTVRQPAAGRVAWVSGRLPVIIGVLDTISIIAYVLNAELLLFQGAVFGAKLLLVPLSLRKRSVTVLHLPLLLAFVLCCLTSLVLALYPTPDAVIQTSAFLGNLALTLMLLPEEIGPYLRVTSVMIGVFDAIYVAAAVIGRIPIINGRHQYFNGAEPNLGAEIAAMGVVAGAMTLRMPQFLMVAVPGLILALLTQGRAAILAIALTIAIKGYRFLLASGQHSRIRLWAMASLPFALVGVITSLPYLVASLMLNDKDRGFGAGVSGRGELWQTAFNFFQARPLTGIGLGGYGALKLLPPHNFVLYAMAEMGLLAFAVFAMMGYMAVASYRKCGPPVFYLAALIPLLLFNARLFNLNVYPFLMFVALFGLSVREPVTTRPSRLRRLMRVG